MQLLKLSDRAILDRVEPLMNNLMEGSTNINHPQHTRDFTARLKTIVTPDRLNKMCAIYQADWGLFTDRDFIALFRREKSIVVIWRQYCGHSFDEYIAEAVFVEQGDQLLIDHVMVF